jgi:hypothetical protein
LSVEAPVTEPENVDLTLIESMVVVLSGMTASVWPDRVFAMAGTEDEVTGSLLDRQGGSLFNRRQHTLI